jgi:MGT family glycosyltransferase
MARFLLAVWPLPGHYFPNLALARSLMARGHEVAVCTGRRAQQAVEDAGVACLPFAHTDEQPFERVFYSLDRRHAAWRPKLLAARDDYYNWIAGTLDGQVRDVMNAIEAWQPDVVVCDPALWGPFLVLPERAAAKVAIFSYVPFCPLPGKDIAPVGPGLPPPRTPLQHAGAQLLRRAFRLATGRFRERANDLRRAYGLAALDVTPTEYAGRVPLYLVAGTREFDYHRTDLPESVRYVGPCLWTRERLEPARWLADAPPGSKWIHVTEGTVNTRGPVLSRAAAIGLAGHALPVVISTSARGAAADLGVGPLAPNVRVEHWTDIHLQDLLPHTRVVVTAGGAGIVMAALQHGVPLVIAPTDWDKPEIAQRVVESGAGVRLSRRQWTARGVANAVDRVLTTPSFALQARRLSDQFARCGGPAEAATLLEEHAFKGAVGATDLAPVRSTTVCIERREPLVSSTPAQR